MAGNVIISATDLTDADLQLADMESDIGTGELLLSIEDMQYQGFAPRMFLASLWGKAKALAVTEVIHKRNVRAMALLGLIRGNKLAKLRAGGNVNLANSITEWIRVYRLTDAKPTGPYDVTLVRVSAALVMMLSKCLHAGTPGVTATIHPNNVCANFPPGMALSNFGALIPRTLPQEELRVMEKAFFYHQFLFDRTINSSSKIYASKTDIERYAFIQINSPLYNDESRAQHCIAIGVVSMVAGVLTITARAREPLMQAANQWDAIP